jgi:alginate O-acetyltransferase complex protein AlgJ
MKNPSALSGAFFLGLLGLSCFMGLYVTGSALSTLERPAPIDIVHGKWTPLFEKALNTALPVDAPSRNFWGRAEYAMFHQGRKGVVVGADGWLYSDEEFSCPPQAAQNLKDNLDFIAAARKTFSDKGVRVAVVVVPAKSRVVDDHLGAARMPACRKDVYAAIGDFLKEQKIPATDLLPVMRADPSREALYLHTDTHWAPAGALLAARETGKLLQTDLRDLGLGTQVFISKSSGVSTHEGDLMRYTPGVASADLPPDQLMNYATEAAPTQEASAGGDQSALFGDSVPPVTLVGTSYSANKKWNFQGFLKESLKTDIIDAADEGQGPFTVMDKYLASDDWKKNPPRLVLWEIPERYLLMPHGVSDSK